MNDYLEEVDHRGCRKGKLLLGAAVVTLFLLHTNQVVATRVVFIDGTGDGEPRTISEGNDSSLCQRGNRLYGLDKTRLVLGEPNCAGAGVEQSPPYSEEIDLVILVDDRRGVDDNIRERLDGVEGRSLTCATSGTRRRIYPSYIVLDGDNQQLRALVVGEEMIDTYFSESNDVEPWAQYLAQIIARAQGTDASPDRGPYSPSVSSAASNNIPAGKGLFQNRPLNRLVNNRFRPFKMGHMASRFHDNGLNWFALSAPVGEKCEGRLYTEFIRFEHPTFQTFVWMLNHSDHIDEQIDQMIRAVKNTRSQGFMIDIEGQAFRRHRDEARQLYARAREKAEEFSRSDHGWPVSVGITVIGFPNLPAYVSDEDLRAADFIMPQIYNRADNLSSTAIRGRIDFWRTSYAGENVIPLAGAHHCELAEGEMSCSDERAKNASEFEDTIAPFRNSDLSSIGWWRYGSVESGDHWQRLAEFDLTNEVQQ